MSDNESQQNAAKGVVKLVFIVFGMFGFGFAMVPLYDVICDITGLNGKTDGQYVVTETLEVDENRWVTVQFTTSNNAGMPWDFRPEVTSVKVRPGEINEAFFVAANVTSYNMTGQAIPSVSPSAAAQYMHKTECFCFNHQELAAGEEIRMPLRFFIDKEIPENVTKLTLSYTLFDLPQVAAN